MNFGKIFILNGFSNPVRIFAFHIWSTNKKKGVIDGELERQTDERIYGRMDGRTKRHMDGQMDGKINGQIEGRRDGWMDR